MGLDLNTRLVELQPHNVGEVLPYFPVLESTVFDRFYKAYKPSAYKGKNFSYSLTFYY